MCNVWESSINVKHVVIISGKAENRNVPNAVQIGLPADNPPCRVINIVHGMARLALPIISTGKVN